MQSQHQPWSSTSLFFMFPCKRDTPGYGTPWRNRRWHHRHCKLAVFDDDFLTGLDARHCIRQFIGCISVRDVNAHHVTMITEVFKTGVDEIVAVEASRLRIAEIRNYIPQHNNDHNPSSGIRLPIRYSIRSPAFVQGL